MNRSQGTDYWVHLCHFLWSGVNAADLTDTHILLPSFGEFRPSFTCFSSLHLPFILSLCLQEFIQVDRSLKLHRIKDEAGKGHMKKNRVSSSISSHTVRQLKGNQVNAVHCVTGIFSLSLSLSLSPLPNVSLFTLFLCVYLCVCEKKRQQGSRGEM